MFLTRKLIYNPMITSVTDGSTIGDDNTQDMRITETVPKSPRTVIG